MEIDRRQCSYTEEVYSAADRRLANEDLTPEDRSHLLDRVIENARREVSADALDGASFDEIGDWLGPPESLADAVIDAELASRRPPGPDEEGGGQ